MSKQRVSSTNSEKLKKSTYNVTYLGWKECPGLYGIENTTPIVQEMIYAPRPDNFNFEDLPRLVMNVSRKELKITQTVTKKPGKTETIKFHVVPMKELMFAARGSPPDDSVVACIYLGLNKQTKSWTHVHAYLCENSIDAETLIRHLYQYINTPYHRDRLVRIERDLVKKGHVKPHVAIRDSPVDEMGFPSQYETNTEQNSSEPSYAVYGTAGDVSAGNDYNIYAGFPGGQQKPTEEEPLPTVFQQYHLPADSTGAPLKLPRVSASRTSLEGMVVPQATLDQQQLYGSNGGSRYASGSSHSSATSETIFGTQYANNSLERRPGSGSDNDAFFPAPNVPGGFAGTRAPQDNEYGRQKPVEIEECPPDYDPLPRRAPVESALAAELRTKLGKGAILLPPKDYDTVSRAHGNLAGIDSRRSQNNKVVGKTEADQPMSGGQTDWATKDRSKFYRC